MSVKAGKLLGYEIKVTKETLKKDKKVCLSFFRLKNKINRDIHKSK